LIAAHFPAWDLRFGSGNIDWFTWLPWRSSIIWPLPAKGNWGLALALHDF
jgi:hypothetical protein